MYYSVQEGTPIRLRSRWKVCGLDFAAVITFLRASKVPSMNTVTEGRAWHRLHLGAGQELGVSFCPWHHGCHRGEEKGEELRDERKEAEALG